MSTQLTQYAALLRQWTRKINLIAPSTIADLEQRHVADSAQLLPYLPTTPSQILDCGSGGGLPGLVLAILAPQHTFTLAERDQRKAAFLHTVKHQLGLTNVRVHDADVTNLPPHSFHLITARAWADTHDILRLTTPLLRTPNEGGIGWLLLKGEAVSRELNDLDSLSISTHPSTVHPNSWIVQLSPKTEA